jgi:hypothetical protein
MVDRLARDAAAEALAGFASGRLSNREYEARFPRSRTDSSLRAIYVAVWFTYSDIRDQVVGRELALSGQQCECLQRCIAFLRSDIDFQWPAPKFRLWYGLIRLFGGSRMLERMEDRQLAVGDRTAWPFLTKDQMAIACRAVRPSDATSGRR